jgi:hypothetical protein
LVAFTASAATWRTITFCGGAGFSPQPGAITASAATHTALEMFSTDFNDEHSAPAGAFARPILAKGFRLLISDGNP